MLFPSRSPRLSRRATLPTRPRRWLATLLLSSLTLGVLLLGCGRNGRPDERSQLRPPATAAHDSAAFARRLAQIDSIGPRAGSDRAALGQLGRAIGDPRPAAASRAAYWLAKAGAPAVPVLLRALDDGTPRVRASAAYALGLLGPEARGALPALTRELGGVDDSTAKMADWAITQIVPTGKGALFPDLRRLRYGPMEERTDAAERLGGLGEASAVAIPLLVRSLGDSDGVVAQAAGNALASIGRLAIPSLQAAELSDDHTLRARAVVVLSRLQPTSQF